MAEAETIHDELKHPMIAADAEEMEAGALMGRFQSRCVTPGEDCRLLPASQRYGENSRLCFAEKSGMMGKRPGFGPGRRGCR